EQHEPQSRGASQLNQAGSKQDSHCGPQQVSGQHPQQVIQGIEQPGEHEPHDELQHGDPPHLFGTGIPQPKRQHFIHML
ncbi:hypothetical protein KR215_009171, partial [Drosophila sulfurigaster]